MPAPRRDPPPEKRRRPVGERRYTVMVVPEGAQGPIRQVTLPLAHVRLLVAGVVALVTVALLGVGLALTTLPSTSTKGRLLDENLALRGRIGEIEGKLDTVEREMQRLRLYGTQIEDLPPDKLPGFGPMDADDIAASARMGEGVIVDAGRLQLLGEAGMPMDDHPDVYDGRGAASERPEASVVELDRRTDRLLAALRVLEIELGHQAEAAEHLRSMQLAVPRGWPVDGAVLTSGFGWRRSPFTRRWKFHSGLDLAAAKGAPIHAPAPGTIVTADFQSGYGKVVEIDHGFGIVSRYAHNARLFVAEGQLVKRGEPISTVGMTGATTGPHLHYEIRVDGVPVDPLEYLE